MASDSSIYNRKLCIVRFCNKPIPESNARRVTCGLPSCVLANEKAVKKRLNAKPEAREARRLDKQDARKRLLESAPFPKFKGVQKYIINLYAENPRKSYNTSELAKRFETTIGTIMNAKYRIRRSGLNLISIPKFKGLQKKIIDLFAKNPHRHYSNNELANLFGTTNATIRDAKYRIKKKGLFGTYLKPRLKGIQKRIADLLVKNPVNFYRNNDLANIIGVSNQIIRNAKYKIKIKELCILRPIDKLKGIQKKLVDLAIASPGKLYRIYELAEMFGVPSQSIRNAKCMIKKKGFFPQLSLS